MSSHHFVKEGQEPALFILEALEFKYVEPLLEWVPLIIVVDGILDDVLKWGIKIDAVLHNDLKLKELEDKLEDQFPVQIVPSEKHNAITTGLQFLIGKGIMSVNVVSRPEETLFQNLTDLSSQLQIGVIGDQKWFLVRTGKLEKWLPNGYKILLRSTNGSLLHHEGMVQNGEFCESLKEGIVTIHSDSPFWVGEPINDL